MGKVREALSTAGEGIALVADLFGICCWRMAMDKLESSTTFTGDSMSCVLSHMSREHAYIDRVSTLYHSTSQERLGWTLRKCLKYSV